MNGLKHRIRVSAAIAGIGILDLCARVGFSPTFLYSIEKGKRPFPRARLEKMAEILGVTPAWLLGQEGGGDVD